MMNKLHEFVIKVFTIVVAVIVVLFFVNYWIIKPIKEIKNLQEINYKKEVKDIKRYEKENIKIDWRDAKKHIGAYIITEGEIVSSYNSGKVCYLNFHKDFRNYLSLVIFASAFKKFPENPEKFYLGKKIRVEGRIKVYNERLEIILESPDQIKIIK